MVDRLNFTMNELISSQQHADAMSRLATMDSLTGMQNKTSFDRHSELLKQGLDEGEKEFGFVMLDLNNLKLINDNYGHEKGDMAIIRLCHIICEIFVHSPVFRVGGDEFVVIVKNEDYKNVETLVNRFKARVHVTSRDRTADPWDRVSAAVGYALYDEKVDSDLQSVFDRADKEMYQCKRQMKAA
jgi:diguanylate cyclase (GGDEF)-like protein